MSSTEQKTNLFLILTKKGKKEVKP